MAGLYVSGDRFLMPFRRDSALKRYLISGVPEFEKVIRSMTDTELDATILPVLTRIAQPYRDRLINYYANKDGKYDGENLKRALSHRWWNKFRKQGLPVGHTRVLALRALALENFGFKVARLQKGDGYFMRVKAWGPGIFLTEHGRYKGANTYRGWGGAVAILKRFAFTAQSALNRELPAAFERLASQAAAKAGVK